MGELLRRSSTGQGQKCHQSRSERVESCSADHTAMDRATARLGGHDLAARAQAGQDLPTGTKVLPDVGRKVLDRLAR
jgi:hypothetical protein